MGIPSRHIAVVPLFCVASALVTALATACVCERQMTPEEGLAQASYVFVGRVIREEVPSVTKTIRPDGRQTVTADWTRWDLAVSRAWKGAPPETVAVYSCMSLSCGLRLKVGYEFLVYGWVHEDQGGPYTHWPKDTEFPVIAIGACTPTKLLEKAKEDLVSLGEPKWRETLPPSPPTPSEHEHVPSPTSPR